MNQNGIAPLIIVAVIVVAAVVAGVGIYIAMRSGGTGGSGASSNFVRSPVANFNLNPENVMAYYNIQFTDNSLDPLGMISSWSWNFGDSSISTDQNPVHIYTEPGTYEVSLNVTDNNKNSDNCIRNIEVSSWLGEDNESLDENLGLNTATGHDTLLYNNPYAKDPTWDNLKSFLQQDNTKGIPYVDHIFVCADYAETLHNNAERVGIRAAYVFVNLSGVGHACDAFRTTDMVFGTTGMRLVFIDVTNSMPSTNNVKRVEVEVGQEYQLTSLFSGQQFLSMGVVDFYEITW